MYYIHVLAHVYSTRASTCVYYTCLESKWSLFTWPFLQLQEYTSWNSVCPPSLQHFQSKVGTQKKIRDLLSSILARPDAGFLGLLPISWRCHCPQMSSGFRDTLSRVNIRCSTPIWLSSVHNFFIFGTSIVVSTLVNKSKLTNIFNKNKYHFLFLCSNSNGLDFVWK